MENGKIIVIENIKRQSCRWSHSILLRTFYVWIARETNIPGGVFNNHHFLLGGDKNIRAHRSFSRNKSSKGSLHSLCQNAGIINKRNSSTGDIKK